jgi:type I restriction enzyme S subunit
MERYELPEGWEWKQLGDKNYFDLIMGQSPPSHTYNLKGEGLPFFQGKAEFGELHPVAKKHCSAPTRTAKKDDFLISVRAPVGPTNLADRECCIGRGLAAIRCKEKALPRYLLYALRNMGSEIAEMVRDQGGGFTAIKRNQLAAIEIPLPPLAEQRRIVARIEEISRRVEEARNLQQEIHSELNKVIPSVLSKAFRGEL